VLSFVAPGLYQNDVDLFLNVTIGIGFVFELPVLRLLLTLLHVVHRHSCCGRAATPFWDWRWLLQWSVLRRTWSV
jgi:Sec-independent protein secretion pathway component TatC